MTSAAAGDAGGALDLSSLADAAAALAPASAESAWLSPASLTLSQALSRDVLITLYPFLTLRQLNAAMQTSRSALAAEARLKPRSLAFTNARGESRLRLLLRSRLRRHVAELNIPKSYQFGVVPSALSVIASPAMPNITALTLEEWPLRFHASANALFLPRSLTRLSICFSLAVNQDAKRGSDEGRKHAGDAKYRDALTAAVKRMAACAPHLTSLSMSLRNLDGCALYFSPSALQVLGPALPRLRELLLNTERNEQGDELRYLSWKQFPVLMDQNQVRAVRGCKMLQQFTTWPALSGACWEWMTEPPDAPPPLLSLDHSVVFPQEPVAFARLGATLLSLKLDMVNAEQLAIILAGMQVLTSFTLGASWDNPAGRALVDAMALVGATLTSFDCASLRLDEEGSLDDLLQAMPQLQRLTITDGGGDDDYPLSLLPFARCAHLHHQLTELSLNLSATDPAEIVHLRHLHALQWLGLYSMELSEDQLAEIDPWSETFRFEDWPHLAELTYEPPTEEVHERGYTTDEG